MEITDIKVRKLFDEGPMKAIVSVTFDGQLALHDVKVISAREKIFIVMPSRKNPDGTYRDIVHPINSDFRARMEEQVIDAYNREVALAEVMANEENSESAFADGSEGTDL
ncbi:MAG: septation regulator SpoVG [Ruminococcaceae bacterium]|nr:septation regulator SpoVG [Oscillospiraceae bacterium]